MDETSTQHACTERTKRTHPFLCPSNQVGAYAWTYAHVQMSSNTTVNSDWKLKNADWKKSVESGKRRSMGGSEWKERTLHKD